LTTTETRIDPELDTRMLTVVTDDSADQTRAVLLAIAGEEDRAEEIDYRRWRRGWVPCGREARLRAFVEQPGAVE